MIFRTTTVLISLCILVSGCTGATFNETFGLSGVYNWGCNSNKLKAAEEASWDQAEIVTETIKDGIYQTGALTLRLGSPHIIEITNADDQARSFRSQELFTNSSILKVVHEGLDVSAPCLRAVTIAAKKTSEIHLVPAKKGYYDYYETYLTTPGLNLLPIIAPVGSIGTVYVD